MLVGGSVSILGAGCAIEGEPDAGRTEAPRTVALDGEDSQCVRLMAGQHHHVGWVCTSVDHEVDTSPHCGPDSSGVLVVTYETFGGWKLYAEHLAVGDEHGHIPMNHGGNPQPGQFPEHHEDSDGHTSYSFYVPLCEIGMHASGGDCEPKTLYFAAHAEVKKYHGDECQEETAWGEGESLGNNWSMYFTHDLHCEHEPC
jgi:hypothetical protein